MVHWWRRRRILVIVMDLRITLYNSEEWSAAQDIFYESSRYRMLGGWHHLELGFSNLALGIWSKIFWTLPLSGLCPQRF